MAIGASMVCRFTEGDVALSKEVVSVEFCFSDAGSRSSVLKPGPSTHRLLDVAGLAKSISQAGLGCQIYLSSFVRDYTWLPVSRL